MWLLSALKSRSGLKSTAYCRAKPNRLSLRLIIAGLRKPWHSGVERFMESEVKKELLRLAKRLRAKAEEFEKAKDFGKAEQCRVYAAYLEETVHGMD